MSVCGAGRAKTRARRGETRVASNRAAPCRSPPSRDGALARTASSCSVATTRYSSIARVEEVRSTHVSARQRSHTSRSGTWMRRTARGPMVRGVFRSTGCNLALRSRHGCLNIGKLSEYQSYKRKNNS